MEFYLQLSSRLRVLVHDGLLVPKGYPEPLTAVKPMRLPACSAVSGGSGHDLVETIEDPGRQLNPETAVIRWVDVGCLELTHSCRSAPPRAKQKKPPLSAVDSTVESYDDF